MANGDIFGFIFKPNATPHIKEQIWANIKIQFYLSTRQKRLDQQNYPFDWGRIISSQFVKFGFYSKAFVQVEHESEYCTNVMNVSFKTWNLKPITNNAETSQIRLRSNVPFLENKWIFDQLKAKKICQQSFD